MENQTQYLVSGGVRGTLPWMAPELLNGSRSRVSDKVEVFSFGISMREILTGEEPYANMHCGAILNERCDSERKNLMEQCWSSDPDIRPSFTEITNRLQAMSNALQGKKMGSDVQIQRYGIYDVLQAELGMKLVMLRDIDQSAIDGDRSTIIPETISTDDPSDVPNELPIVGMSNELPFDDQLPAVGMTNELHVDGSSSDDSSNGLVQDGDIHEVDSDDSSTYQLLPRVNSGKHKLSSVSVLTKLHDVLSDLKWVNAMNVEMKALEKNSVWDLFPLPNGKKVVGCRWVFTIKYKVDGSIDWYKARLVAKGYTQTYGVDYQETFAHVAKLNIVHVLLSLAANQDWLLLQFNVKNAFLHSDLKEEVYIDVPPRIVTSDDQEEVQRLQKYLNTEFEMKELALSSFYSISNCVEFLRRYTNDQVPIFLSTQAKSFFFTMAARKVMLERRIVWEDLSLADVIRSDNLVERYRLHKDLVNFIRRNVLGTSNKGNLTLESTRVLFAKLTHCDVLFGFLIFKSILSKFKHAATYQRGSTIHLCLITQLCELVGVQKRPDDLCPRTTKDIDINMMNLSNVMCDVAHNDLRPVLPSTASQDKKIAYLKSEINSLRKQFVDFKFLVNQPSSSPLVSNSFSWPSLSQTSSNPSSFVLELSLRPPKLVPYRHIDHSSISYHTVASSDEDEECLDHDLCPGDVPVEDVIATRSSVGLEDLSQLEEF
ncbi:hypothetical protein D8674_027057 [Pyrus ussuriensis x Pyrus communis]|uniref:Protein kinase domain-containing protein n=1 Tax=Pyrus ussuriensis x Pyrus communis TaxID=2448454 RepID=A0A5N5IBQ0_9ROSA|nr:hypothetical protein D8674_027057 [Pyrus ussuriensis x Pyrus communis]